jgi:hypothetical protein
LAIWFATFRCLSVHIHSRPAAQKQSSSISTRASRERGHTLDSIYFSASVVEKRTRASACLYVHTQSEKVVAGVNNRLRAVSLSRGEHLRQVEIGILTRMQTAGRPQGRRAVSFGFQDISTEQAAILIYQREYIFYPTSSC